MSDVTDLLEKQADVLFSNIAGWEQSALQRIGARIGKVGKMSAADAKALNNIATVKQDMDAITKELARITGLNISQIQKIYGDVIAQQHAENQPLYDYRGKKFVPFAENKELQAIVRAYAKTTGGTMLNLAKTKALCILDKNGTVKGLQRYYTDVLDKAVMQVTSGALDFHTAMRDSIVELGGSGVRVDYGGGITRRLDTVVRQNLLWGAKQASTEYNEMIGEELGCDGIEIDWHSCPRPSHEFMQGKQYALGKARTINGVAFESADEALERLQDYGCLHYKTPIICGISEPRYDPEELKRLNEQNNKTYDIGGKTVTGYEATQQMRRLETAVRSEKDIRETARASGDALQVRRSNAKIKTYQDKYKEISDITGIAQYTKRMSVPRTAQKVTDGLKNGADSGIIRAEHYELAEKQQSKGSETDSSKISSTKRKDTSSVVEENSVSTGSELFTTEAKAQLLRTEIINNGNKYETAYVFDANGKIKFKVKGSAHQVDFTSQQIRDMKGCVVTHNHPSNESFSSADIYMLKKTKASELRASTRFGTYVIGQPQKWHSDISTYDKLAKTYDSYVDEYILRYKDKAAQEGKPILYYLQNAEEDATKAFTEKYGMKFRLEKYDDK